MDQPILLRLAFKFLNLRCVVGVDANVPVSSGYFEYETMIVIKLVALVT